jgi:site-specific DNA recombinase
VKSLSQASVRRAAIYCRVSTAVQEDGTSLDTQEAACRSHAVDHALHLNEEFVYREVYTGTELWERPVLTRLRNAIRHRDVDVVVAYAIDRLSRDPVHLGVILSEADHAGVDVQFVTEPLDNSPEGQLIRFIRGYAAKVEHEKIKERSIRGKRAKAQAGKMLPGCRAPYGYRWVDAAKSGLEPDPSTAPIVQRIFDDVSAGRTLRQIAAALTAGSIPTPTGKGKPRWNHQSVKWILQSPTYTGEPVAFRYTKTGATNRYGVAPVERHIPLPQGTVPALITREIYEAAQERLQRNRDLAARNNPHPEQTLLRGGYVRCGHCNGTLQVKRARSFTKRQADTYFCHTALK